VIVPQLGYYFRPATLGRRSDVFSGPEAGTALLNSALFYGWTRNYE